MNIFQLNKILLEYNKSGNLTTLSDVTGDKTSGKNLDNVATGVTTPTKQSIHKQSEIEKQFPNLAKIVEQLKNSGISGNKIVVGAALNELQNLIQLRNLQKDENGEIILPFGDNVRLLQNGNNAFIYIKNITNQQNQNQITDLTKNPLPNL